MDPARAAEDPGLGERPGSDYSERVRALRERLSLTQQALAERLGVSFATVNRWENQQTRPSRLYWAQLRQLESRISDIEVRYSGPTPEALPPLDFTGDPEAVRLVVEGERLSFGHLANPVFATEVSRVDPLPHQRIAVYDHMLTQPRLRFLLADDAGAGKTIMSGLYIREMLSRRLLRRILIVPPAGLVGNWRRELLTLFNLVFRIVRGEDARTENPFVGPAGDRVIVSVDTLGSPLMFERLRDPGVLPSDLVIFDEAPNLSPAPGADLRVRKTDRYRLAASLAGLKAADERWRLGWSAHHLLLLTATPHMGKDYPYYALWRLLEPDVFTTPDALEAFPREERRRYFIRRTKEEMVHLDGRPLYPPRLSDTLGYELSSGEAELYEETTDYLRYVYNRAKLLNREAARLAMGVFQRRLASSTYALLRSFERRMEKLDTLIQDIQDGRITTEQMLTLQARLHEEDELDTTTADDEGDEEHGEAHEAAEDRLLQGVVAASLADLLAEREQVARLQRLARAVLESGQESKFEKLRELLTDGRYGGEKLIVFTEHRDTAEYLVRRLGGLGFTGQVAQIHGAMAYTQRDQEVERFRAAEGQGGARFLICTDAAGEGINLQFCRTMINYDVPWNPARLEQRMGRIHRYKQVYPVTIANLVAPATREGKVLKVLLEKLERIRKELRSDKVFDCVGRLFEGVSLKHYMELALATDAQTAAAEMDAHLDPARVVAVARTEKSRYGSGDVDRELPRLRKGMDQEVYFRLLPGYVRQYVQGVAPLVDLEVDGSLDGVFALRPRSLGALDPLLSALELYPEGSVLRLSAERPADRTDAIWLHPGEPVFERLRAVAQARLSRAALRGAVFVDPTATRPYLVHVALLSVVRRAEPEIEGLEQQEVLDCRLVAVRQYGGAQIETCPVEQLLLLRGGQGLPPTAQRLALTASGDRDAAKAFLAERLARGLAVERKESLAAELPERESFLRRGFDYQETELAVLRAKHTEKARGGNRKAVDALEEVRRQQRDLAERRRGALETLRRLPELVAPGELSFVAHALVVPSSDPADAEQHERNVEAVAMQVARAFEESEGAAVQDVHTPELARQAGLPDNPGFDLLSRRPDGNQRSIEVKGRAAGGDVEVTANEWGRAANLRDTYWLYVVYDCAAAHPRLERVQDPFAALLTRAKGSVLVSRAQVMEASGGGP